MSLEQKKLTACHQRKTSHFTPIFKLSITYHHIIRMKDFDNTSSNEAQIPQILDLLINVSKWKIPSFSLLTGLLASYICSALYLFHSETNSRSLSLFPKTYLAIVNLTRWLENIFTASTIFLLSLSLWLLFATRDSEQVEAFDYSAQECRIPWKFFENFRSVPNKIASMFHSVVLSSPCKYINRCPSSIPKTFLIKY